MVRKAVSSWSVTGVTYSYTSRCYLPIGEGGAIYTNNTDLIIDNSVFNKNSAYKGGAIASKYVSAAASAKSNVDLIITNSSFINNRANDTKVRENKDLVDNYNYNNNHDGGAIYGAFNKFRLYGSDFRDNQAINDGGALYVQSGDALIDLCNFIGNRAGSSGGALFISNNFLITRTVISNNSARYGGALTYDSYYYYGHVQNNLNIYNSTISDNMALADMRYNYWGPTQLNGRPANADNSVYNFPNIRIGSRLSEYVNWIIPKEDNNEDDNPATPINTDDGDNTPGTVNPTSTNTHSSTNINIGEGDSNSVGGYGGTVIGPSGNSNKLGSNLGEGDGGASNPIGNIIDALLPKGIDIPVPRTIPNTNTGNPDFIYQDIPSYNPTSSDPISPVPVNPNPVNPIPIDNGGNGKNNNVNTQNGTAEGSSVSRYFWFSG